MDDEDHEVVEITTGNMKKLMFTQGSVICIGDPNIRNMFDWTPLLLAAANGFDNYKGVEALVNIGAEMNARDRKGRTALSLASLFHNWKITDTLLHYGANPNIPDYMGRTPLHYAPYHFSLWKDIDGHLPIAQSLLQNGANVNYPDKDHETPLMSAIRNEHLDIIEELLEWDANVHARNNQFETCLHKACKLRVARDTKRGKSILDDEILILLLKHRACTECFDQNGMTALDLILASDNRWKEKMAIQFVKMAILANKGYWSESYLVQGYPKLRRFIRQCYEEVIRMRTIRSANMSLCDFAFRKDLYADDNWVTEKSIFDKALEHLKNFRIYNYSIKRHFHRSYLLEKMSEMDVYASCETGEVFLSGDIIDHICSFLSNKYLLKFLTTFIKPIHCNEK